MSDRKRLISRIIFKTSLPALLAICLFVLLIFLIILPLMRDALMNQKKDAVKKLIESSYSLVESTYNEYREGSLTEGEAKEEALSILSRLRYDEGMNNYFWVNTIGGVNRSILIMHPYSTDLVGTDVFYLQDPEGTYIFRDMVDIVQEKGEGFTYYEWQYMENPGRIEPKVSFVKLFRPWNWIIGTGLYLDDLDREITHIIRNITKYILILFLFIAVLLFYTVFSSVRTETAKRAAEQNLRDSRAYLESVIDQMPYALFSCDEKWNIRSCNARAALMLGLGRDEIIEKKMGDLLPPISGITGEVDRQDEESRGGRYERRIFSINGRELIFNVTVYALSLENYPRYVIHIDDITAQVQKENQLMQAQKMETVGNLVGGIAHDFNNIIGGIIGTASVMTMKCDEFESLTRDELAGYISLIDEAGERAADMVQHLLSLSRKQETRFTPLDLSLPANHIYKMCRSSFDKGIDIQLRVPGKPSMALADITMIEQVLLNLCINASHAMTVMRKSRDHIGGILLIQLEKFDVDEYFRRDNPDAVEKKYWCLSVQDTGVGIEKKNISKVFEPFFTTKNKEQGSGLGLSMVYNIIRQHKGFIDIYSEPGVGTTVKLYLPVLKDKNWKKAGKEEKKTLQSGTGTVLVVDDDKLIRRLTLEILQECGYRTLHAVDGEEGLEVYRRHRDEIDLVYLDIIMPKKSGVEVFYALKEMNPDVRVLLASGFRKDERVEGVLKMGVDGFLQKPFSIEELSKTVHDIISRG